MTGKGNISRLCICLSAFDTSNLHKPGYLNRILTTCLTRAARRLVSLLDRYLPSASLHRPMSLYLCHWQSICVWPALVRFLYFGPLSTSLSTIWPRLEEAVSRQTDRVWKKDAAHNLSWVIFWKQCPDFLWSQLPCPCRRFGVLLVVEADCASHCCIIYFRHLLRRP